MGIWSAFRRSSRAQRVVERLIAAVNARDFSSLRQLVTPDVRFTDSMGDGVCGQEAAFLLLERLIAFDPGLQIKAETMTDFESSVLVSGQTSGVKGLSSRRTLWRIGLRDGLVAEWRSFSADNPMPVTRMMMDPPAQALA